MEVILSVLKSFAEAKSEDDAGYEKTYEWIIERLDLEELRENHEQLTIILELLKDCFQKKEPIGMLTIVIRLVGHLCSNDEIADFVFDSYPQLLSQTWDWSLNHEEPQIIFSCISSFISILSSQRFITWFFKRDWSTFLKHIFGHPSLYVNEIGRKFLFWMIHHNVLDSSQQNIISNLISQWLLNGTENEKLTTLDLFYQFLKSNETKNDWLLENDHIKNSILLIMDNEGLIRTRAIELLPLFLSISKYQNYIEGEFTSKTEGNNIFIDNIILELLTKENLDFQSTGIRVLASLTSISLKCNYETKIQLLMTLHYFIFELILGETKNFNFEDLPWIGQHHLKIRKSFQNMIHDLRKGIYYQKQYIFFLLESIESFPPTILRSQSTNILNYLIKILDHHIFGMDRRIVILTLNTLKNLIKEMENDFPSSSIETVVETLFHTILQKNIHNNLYVEPFFQMIQFLLPIQNFRTIFFGKKRYTLKEMLGKFMIDSKWEVRDTSLLFLKSIIEISSHVEVSSFIIENNLLVTVIETLNDQESYIRSSCLDVLISANEAQLLNISSSSVSTPQIYTICLQYFNDSEAIVRRSAVDLLSSLLITTHQVPIQEDWLKKGDEIPRGKILINELFFDSDWEVQIRVLHLLSKLIESQQDLHLKIFISIDGYQLLLDTLGESNRKVCEESVKIIEILHQKNLILKDQNREFHDEYFLDIESKLSKLNFEELHSFTEVNEDQGKIVPEEILNHAHTCDNILDCY